MDTADRSQGDLDWTIDIDRTPPTTVYVLFATVSDSGARPAGGLGVFLSPATAIKLGTQLVQAGYTADPDLP